jgi:hypothetical protein
MSATAHPLNALFTALNESRPTQVNIIIDACNAGGLVGDLGTLLKPELIGARDSPSISLLAAASADEYANETNSGGVVTSLLVEYLVGTKKINRTDRYLDLADIGKLISTTIDKQHGQTPTSWALNLYGESRFSKNRHFSQSGSPFADGLFDILPDSEIGKKISQHAESIWEEYRAIGEEPDAYRLANTLRKVIGEMSDDPRGVAAFLSGISNNLEQRAVKSLDIFGPITVVSTLLALLLEFVDDITVQVTVTRLLKRRRELMQECLKSIVQGQQENQYYLLGLTDITADLFLLPIRISKVLGYLWSQVLLDNMTDTKDQEFLDQVVALTSTIYSAYAGSFVAVSDEQAPYIYVMAQAASSAHAGKTISDAINSIFQDLVAHRGDLARANIEPSNLLRFLLGRGHHSERAAPELLANPSQLLAVFLSLSGDLVDEREWDKKLRALDHQSLVVFIPKSFRQFGYQIIRDGINNVFKVGHGIWSLGDFRLEFASECRPVLDRDSSFKETPVQVLSIVSTLVFPDRIPWFLECFQKTH